MYYYIFNSGKKNSIIGSIHNNINIGYEDFIIKALALSLEGNRDFNGSIINDEIMIFGEICNFRRRRIFLKRQNRDLKTKN